ncbi:histidine-type phosphatase [Clavibacter michiganensis]|uniref:Multiple inositol polyphosphate phosphatase 1 n=1 Tax=Clavibacter michiganensis TaxID=28447 RepID=A0A251YJT9_9MICO|nr:histidine-type phosphatase [Clavibacter michiganensis]OUE24413.1 Histidine phosphatase superfamily (branch 2) [Clavibacter michiganensis]
MRLRTRRLSASVALALALGIAAGGSALPAHAATGTGSATGTDAADRPYYSSKTPYAPRGTAADLAPAPAGFAPVYTESVARHGSRALSSFKYDSLTTQVWEQARSEGALTSLGETLGPEVAELTAANQRLGYGNLTGQGADQHRGIGARAVERLPSLFADVDAGSDRVALESSGEARATASGKAFAEGLRTADPLLASHLPADIAKDPGTLYFHKSDANADYQAYEDGPAVTAAVDAITDQPRSHQAARHLLERLYSPAFVDRLAAGAYRFVDGGDGKTTVDDEVDAAMMLYNLYIIAPDMTEEVRVDFDRYLEGADAEWFAYLLDAEDFYSKGPAFQGSDITYRMARPLLDDFLDSMDARLAGSSTAATFRFAHAETIIPFAALIGLPGSTQQVTPEAPYAYGTNEWRGETVTPMAANVQWDVFRDTGGRAIVRMLYDEQAIPFRAGCTPIAPGSPFYDVAEVRRCLTGSAALDPGAPAPGAPGFSAAGSTVPGSPAELAAADASSARGDTLAATGMSADELPFLAVLAFALGAAGITAVGVVRRPRRD